MLDLTIVRCQRAPEVGEHGALEDARPCRARIRPPAGLDGRQDRAHHRHRTGEVQDRDDELRLQLPPAVSDSNPWQMPDWELKLYQWSCGSSTSGPVYEIFYAGQR